MLRLLKGGPGSGHRGHAGRPGSVGGSVPGAGGSTYRGHAVVVLGPVTSMPGWIQLQYTEGPKKGRYHSVRSADVKGGAPKQVESVASDFRRFENADDANDWGFAQASLNPDVTVLEGDLMFEYKSNMFWDVNKQLRDTGRFRAELPSGDIVTEATFDGAFKNSSLPESVTLYRGTTVELLDDLKSESGRSNLVGMVFNDGAYASTSLLESIARGVAEKKDDGLMVEIRARKGTSAIFMEIPGMEVYVGNESEILLNRSTNFRIVKDIPGDGGVLRRLIVETVP